MAKHQKALERLCSTPAPSDFKWLELKGVLEHLGYRMLKNSGSRRKFFHEGKKALIICHQPHPSPDVGKTCITDVVEHLKDYGFII
jgi:predicted RNA binding protein YcfA (HicA-like mRNA interferase family)